MEVIEIASYPKSGNTWFRRIVADFIEQMTGESKIPDDIHGSPDKVLKKEKAFCFPGGGGEFFVYKSHIINSRKMTPDKIIHIQRHPLDVFLSAINHHFVEAKKGSYDEKRLKELFLNGIPKNVEEISADEELDFYFREFLTNAGANYWPGMLGEASNYFEYQFRASRLYDCETIKYEDLSSAFQETARRALGFAFNIQNPYLVIDANKIDQESESSGPFFWRGKSGNFREFLSEDQVNEFYNKYRSDMEWLGYVGMEDGQSYR